MISLLQDWMNEYLDDESNNSINITSMEEDLADGLVLKKLMEKLLNERIEIPFDGFVQGKDRQKSNLKAVLNKIEKCLNFTHYK